MPVTEVGICNSALIKIGSDPISSLSQDTRAARLMNSIFTSSRDEVLSAHPWNFSIKRAELTASATTPEFEFNYSYPLPQDYLRVLDTNFDTYDSNSGCEFVVEDGAVLSNEPELSIRYIFRNTDPTLWSPTFGQALSWKLAYEVCYALTNSTERANFCEQQYRRVLSDARSYDGAEGITKGFKADIFTNARR